MEMKFIIWYLVYWIVTEIGLVCEYGFSYWEKKESLYTSGIRVSADLTRVGIFLLLYFCFIK
jgi:hypothetical protein